MTKEEWLNDYIGAFNRGDFATFTAFYDENVVLHLGGKRTIHGRQGIVDFYTDVFKRIEETLIVDEVVMDETGLAGLVRTEFKAKEDWPDFIAGPIRQGESIHIESIVLYKIGPHGKFTEIRSARSKG